MATVTEFEKIKVLSINHGMKLLTEIAKKRAGLYADLLMVTDYELVDNLEDQLRALNVLKIDIKRQLKNSYVA